MRDSLKTLSTFGVTGGGMMITGPGGIQSVSGTSAASEGTKFAVVREIEPANLKNKWFLAQQLLKDTTNSPWDGEWTIESNPASVVYCFPGLLAEHYLQFVYRGEIVDVNTPIILVIKVEGQWTALQSFKFMLPKREFNPNYKLSDCKLPEREV